MKKQCNDNQIDHKHQDKDDDDDNTRRQCKRQQSTSMGTTTEAVAVLVVLIGALLCSSSSSSALAAPAGQQSSSQSASSPITSSAGAGGGDGESTAASQSALEAELNALLQQHEDVSSGADSKSLSEAIISRLMLANLSDARADSNEESRAADDGQDEPSSQQQQPQLELSGSEATRLRKLLAHLHNYGLLPAPGSLGGAINNGQAFDQFPVLPASQAATIKRASMKLGNLVRGGGGVGGSQSHYSGAQRQLNGAYGRTQSFDFGLGKRPDASVAGSFLRLGDSGGGHLQTVAGQLGKRPSAHRYDFGLGKRVASPAYPRYDFGLGKRVPNRIRYDFGLGK